MKEHRVIKKYSNRRMYDSTARSYVTADDIKKLIIDGEDIKVIEDANGEDITRLLLLQIIAEQERGTNALLDDQFLMNVIRFYGHPVQEMMNRYLVYVMNSFAAQQQLLHNNMQAMIAHSFPEEAFDSTSNPDLAAWQNWQSAFVNYPVADEKRED